jgi:hypothetical protein
MKRHAKSKHKSSIQKVLHSLLPFHISISHCIAMTRHTIHKPLTRQTRWKAWNVTAWKSKYFIYWNVCSIPIKVKVKVKLPLCFLTEHHAMKAYWGSGGIAPRILNLGTRWRWVVSFTPRPLYPQGKNASYSSDGRLDGPQSRSGRGGEEKNSQPLPRLEPPINQPVAQRYIAELSRVFVVFLCKTFLIINRQN